MDLAELLPSWELAMKAEGKAAGTVKTYTDGVRLFLRWCARTGTPAELTKATVQAWLSNLLDGGAEPATAVARWKGVRQYSRWLAAEGELDTDPLDGLRRPKQTTKVIDALTDDQVRALLATCKAKTLRDVRDAALIRFMVETGARAAEVLGLAVGDVDLGRGVAVVHRGKGGKGRVVPFGAKTATAIDRYLRLARRQGLIGDSGALWVGSGGRSFGYHGLRESLMPRAGQAGIAGFHLHRLRHTAAARWLRAGGSEQGLMAVAGWSTRAMIDRYTGASASERAAAEARTLNLGDL